MDKNGKNSRMTGGGRNCGNIIPHSDMSYRGKCGIILGMRFYTV